MTCAIDKLLTTVGGTSSPGSCQPFPLSKIPITMETSACAVRCLDGLPENANLQQVRLSRAGKNVGRPDACVLIYRREPGYQRGNNDDDKYNDVIRDHRVVRRDPVLNSVGQILWMAI